MDADYIDRLENEIYKLKVFIWKRKPDGIRMSQWLEIDEDRVLTWLEETV